MAMHENCFATSLDRSAGALRSSNGCEGDPPPALPQAKPSCLTQRVHQTRLPSGPKRLQGHGDGPCLQMMEMLWCEGTRERIVTMCFQ